MISIISGFCQVGGFILSDDCLEVIGNKATLDASADARFLSELRRKDELLALHFLRRLPHTLVELMLLLTARSYLDKINSITVCWIYELVLSLCLLKCVKDKVEPIYDDKLFKTISFDKVNKIVNA